MRRLLVLKVWHDVVDDQLGSRPFDPAEIIDAMDSRRLPPEDIGLLTQPAEPLVWLHRVQTRYAFVVALDDEEKGIVACNPADRYAVSRMVEALKSDVLRARSG